jgi:uncharacterized protein (DUF885 family)
MNEELQRYMKDYWENVLKCNPTYATYIGDHRYDDLLEDLSEEAISAQAGYFKGLLEKTENIDEAALTEENKLNCRLLKKTLSNHVRLHRYRTWYIPLGHMQGPHIDFPQIIEFHPFNTRKDFDNYIARLKAFPCQVEQVILLLQQGIKNHMTAFGKIIEHVLVQVETFTKFAPEDRKY